MRHAGTLALAPAPPPPVSHAPPSSLRRYKKEPNKAHKHGGVRIFGRRFEPRLCGYRCKPRAVKKTIPARFKSLPAPLVFPNLPTLATSLLASGLVQGSAAVLSASDSNPGMAAVAVITLLYLAVFLALSVTAIVRFHLARSGTWRARPPPAARRPSEVVKEVEDPAHKLLSAALVQLGRAGVDRERGEFEKAEADTDEPERTQRLLNAPLQWFRRRPGDTIDANSVLWLNRATGSSWFGMLHEPSSLFVQLLLQALAGVGDGLAAGSAAAWAQASTICALQISFGLTLLLVAPGADRIDNAVTAGQFFMEGLQTLMLLVGGTHAAGSAEAASLQESAFTCGL